MHEYVNETDESEVRISDKEEKIKYVSCHDLEYGILLFSDGIKHCCNRNSYGTIQDIILYENDHNITNTIQKVIEQKKQIIQDNIDGKETICTNCKYLKEGLWLKEKKVRQINLSLDYLCNLRCKYCDKWEMKYVKQNEFDVINLMKCLENSPLVDITYPVLYSSGEISIQPNINEILEALKNYDVCYFSNATKYNSRLAEKIETKANCLVVSLDCGTSETYKKIKGIDFYDTVCRNIEKYSLHGGNVILKYIVMEENTNQEDLDGFIELCVKNRIKSIIISKDFNDKKIDNKIKNAAAKLAYKAYQEKIRYYFDGIYDIYSNQFNVNYDYL